MINNLIRRLLRNFVLSTLTVDTVQRVIVYVIGHLKSLTPDRADKWLDELDTRALAQVAVDFVLNMIMPTLPIAFEAAEAGNKVWPADLEKEAELVTNEVKAALTPPVK
jgi:hypothetical protein